MYAFDLQAKLRKLNSRLYIDATNPRQVGVDSDGEAVFSAGVHERFALRTRKTEHRDYASTDAQKYLTQVESGESKFHGGIAYPWVPEHDRFDVERGQLLMRGWRSLLTHLAKVGVIDIRKARKVFGCNELGLCSYDKLDYVRKLEREKADAK